MVDLKEMGRTLSALEERVWQTKREEELRRGPKTVFKPSPERGRSSTRLSATTTPSRIAIAQAATSKIGPRAPGSCDIDTFASSHLINSYTPSARTSAQHYGTRPQHQHQHRGSFAQSNTSDGSSSTPIWIQQNHNNGNKCCSSTILRQHNEKENQYSPSTTSHSTSRRQGAPGRGLPGNNYNNGCSSSTKRFYELPYRLEDAPPMDTSCSNVHVLDSASSGCVPQLAPQNKPSGQDLVPSGLVPQNCKQSSHDDLVSTVANHVPRRRANTQSSSSQFVPKEEELPKNHVAQEEKAQMEDNHGVESDNQHHVELLEDDCSPYGGNKRNECISGVQHYSGVQHLSSIHNASSAFFNNITTSTASVFSDQEDQETALDAKDVQMGSRADGEHEFLLLRKSGEAEHSRARAEPPLLREDPNADEPDHELPPFPGPRQVIQLGDDSSSTTLFQKVPLHNARAAGRMESKSLQQAEEEREHAKEVADQENLTLHSCEASPRSSGVNYMAPEGLLYDYNHGKEEQDEESIRQRFHALGLSSLRLQSKTSSAPSVCYMQAESVGEVESEDSNAKDVHHGTCSPPTRWRSSPFSKGKEDEEQRRCTTTTAGIRLLLPGKKQLNEEDLLHDPSFLATSDGHLSRNAVCSSPDISTPTNTLKMLNHPRLLAESFYYSIEDPTILLQNLSDSLSSRCMIMEPEVEHERTEIAEAQGLDEQDDQVDHEVAQAQQAGAQELEQVVDGEKTVILQNQLLPQEMSSKPYYYDYEEESRISLLEENNPQQVRGQAASSAGVDLLDVGASMLDDQPTLFLVNDGRQHDRSSEARYDLCASPVGRSELCIGSLDEPGGGSSRRPPGDENQLQLLLEHRSRSHAQREHEQQAYASSPSTTSITSYASSTLQSTTRSFLGLRDHPVLTASAARERLLRRTNQTSGEMVTTRKKESAEVDKHQNFLHGTRRRRGSEMKATNRPGPGPGSRVEQNLTSSKTDSKSSCSSASIIEISAAGEGRAARGVASICTGSGRTLSGGGVIASGSERRSGASASGGEEERRLPVDKNKTHYHDEGSTSSGQYKTNQLVLDVLEDGLETRQERDGGFNEMTLLETRMINSSNISTAVPSHDIRSKKRTLVVPHTDEQAGAEGNSLAAVVRRRMLQGEREKRTSPFSEHDDAGDLASFPEWQQAWLVKKEEKLQFLRQKDQAQGHEKAVFLAKQDYISPRMTHKDKEHSRRYWEKYEDKKNSKAGGFRETSSARTHISTPSKDPSSARKSAATSLGCQGTPSLKERARAASREASLDDKTRSRWSNMSTQDQLQSLRQSTVLRTTSTGGVKRGATTSLSCSSSSASSICSFMLRGGRGGGETNRSTHCRSGSATSRLAGRGDKADEVLREHILESSANHVDDVNNPVYFTPRSTSGRWYTDAVRIEEKVQREPEDKNKSPRGGIIRPDPSDRGHQLKAERGHQLKPRPRVHELYTLGVERRTREPPPEPDYIPIINERSRIIARKMLEEGRGCLSSLDTGSKNRRKSKLDDVAGIKIKGGKISTNGGRRLTICSTEEEEEEVGAERPPVDISYSKRSEKLELARASAKNNQKMLMQSSGIINRESGLVVLTALEKEQHLAVLEVGREDTGEEEVHVHKNEQGAGSVSTSSAKDAPDDVKTKRLADVKPWEPRKGKASVRSFSSRISSSTSNSKVVVAQVGRGASSSTYRPLKRSSKRTGPSRSATPRISNPSAAAQVFVVNHHATTSRGAIARCSDAASFSGRALEKEARDESRTRKETGGRSFSAGVYICAQSAFLERLTTRRVL
eukprot:GSA25T00014454001.1